MWFAHVLFFIMMYSPSMFRGIQYMNNKSNPLSTQRSVGPKQKTKVRKVAKPKQNGPRVPSASNFYTAPVGAAKIRQQTPPSMNYSKDGREVVVEHTELIVSDVAGSVDFLNRPFPVNPGMSITFPWLSQMAVLFESYQFDKLEFEYENATSSTSVGTVMSAVDYDASDPAPVSKIQLAAYEGYKRSVPWLDFTQKSPKRDLQKRKTYFVRNGTIPAGSSINDFDTGNFNLATQGQATTANIGELYVHYKVKFTTPQLSNPAVGQSKSGRITSTPAVPVLVAPGSNVPLVMTGTTPTALTLTATEPFNCLLVMNGQLNAGVPTVTTAGSTCRIDLPISTVSTVNYQYSAELAFLPGQVLIFNANNGTDTWTGNIAKIAQYNTTVL